jgi:restriction endonuclease Mrr
MEMSEPTSATIAEWIASECLSQEYKVVELFLSEVLTTHLPERSGDEVADLTERLRPSVVKALEELAMQKRSEGITPNYDLQLDEFAAYLRVEPRPELMLLNELQVNTPRQFEEFCSDVLNALGGKASVTGGADDGGIDFVAFNLHLGSQVAPSTIGAKTVVIGQAKRHQTGNNITENQLRNFVGACLRRAYQLKRTNTQLVGSLQPIVFAFWTTSDFHPLAREYAREMGIWYLSGVALAQLALRLNVTATRPVL